MFHLSHSFAIFVRNTHDMKHELYQTPACEVTVLEPRDAVLVSASNQQVTTGYWVDPFGDEDDPNYQ